MSRDAESRAEFHRFFEQHHRELARFAYMITGHPDVADDVAADAFVAAWKRWDRVREAERPLAYVRGIVVKLSRTRLRGLIREERRLRLATAAQQEGAEDPDVAVLLDVRAALRRLPLSKRACVVLRHVFDLSEEETARTLGISVGTVKSQTSRGLKELSRMTRHQAALPTAGR